MVSAPAYLIDTNVLLRLSRQGDPRHQLIDTALSTLNAQGSGLYYSLQNMAEFWNVCTRPVARNGFGLSIAQTNKCVEELDLKLTFLPDNEQVYPLWRQLVLTHNVCGVQVHDARLAALMQAYGLTHILTLNQSDFLRYAGIHAVHPSQIQPPAAII